MSNWHVNEKGEPGLCKASKGGCPFGSADEHYETANAARAAYEDARSAVPEVQKRGINSQDGSDLAFTHEEAPLTQEEEELAPEDATVATNRAPEHYAHYSISEVHEIIDEEEQEAYLHEQEMEYLRRNKWRI